MRLVRCGNTSDPDWYAGHRNEYRGQGSTWPIFYLFLFMYIPHFIERERDKGRLLAGGRIAHIKKKRQGFLFSIFYFLFWQTSGTSHDVFQDK